MSNTILSHMSKCFTCKELVLNLDKTNIIKCITNHKYNLKSGFDDKYIEESVIQKFLGLQIDNHLNWKNHIDPLIPMLSRVCYAIRSVSHISSSDTLKSIFFCLFPFHYEICNNFLG
jgi:hypothetical protein